MATYYLELGVEHWSSEVSVFVGDCGVHVTVVALNEGLIFFEPRDMSLNISVHNSYLGAYPYLVSTQVTNRSSKTIRVAKNVEVEEDGTTYVGRLTKEKSSYTVNLTIKVTKRMQNVGIESSGEFDLVLTVPAMPVDTVTYDANGGNGAPATQSKEFGTTITLSTIKPTRSGYEFGGWLGSDGNTYQPGDTYSENKSLTLTAMWGGQIIFVGNGGGNIPSTIAKPIDEPVTIPDNVPTKAGFIFLSWNTSNSGNGTTYHPGSTIPASMNDTMTLYAMWEKGPDAPTIRKLSAVRCNYDGTPNDDGTYCEVTCEWYVDTTNVSNNRGTVTGRIAQERGTSSAFNFSSGFSGQEGTAKALISNVGTDSQYTITVTVEDKNYSTKMSVILTRARFILDFKSGGLGMGIGSAAPTVGIEFGWPVQFDQDVTVLGNFNADNANYSKDTYTSETEPTCTEMFNPTGTFSSTRVVVQRYGRIVQLNFDLVSASADGMSAGDYINVGEVAYDIAPSETATFAGRYFVGTISGGSVYITVIKPWSGSVDVSATYFSRE